MSNMWYDDLTLVKGLGEALTNAEYLEDNAEFRSFLTKPQKFTEAYNVWEEAGFPTNADDDGWDEFMDGLGLGEETDSNDGD